MRTKRTERSSPLSHSRWQTPRGRSAREKEPAQTDGSLLRSASLFSTWILSSTRISLVGLSSSFFCLFRKEKKKTRLQKINCLVEFAPSLSVYSTECVWAALSRLLPLSLFVRLLPCVCVCVCDRVSVAHWRVIQYSLAFLHGSSSYLKCEGETSGQETDNKRNEIEEIHWT